MTTKIRCHYEVLGIDFDTDSDELKKVYRKLALKYHPDKNPDNVDEATAQFRVVQQAYEVLSDPQERAWYDKHREAILRGGLGGGDKYDDDSHNVFQYFNSSCYSGFGDDEKGFYVLYGKVFKVLAEEDYVFMPDRKKDEEFPKFGLSDSDYEEIVGPFYAFWSSFCTNKSYVWVEKYDIRDAPSRFCRRAMETDNKKLRDAAKKERNEEIRNLVAYVRKRDKRVQAYKKKLEERAVEIEKKAKAKREEELLERKRRMENYEETAWSAMSGLQREMEQLEAHIDDHFGNSFSDEDIEAAVEDDNEDEEDVYDDLYCVACNKAFKSDKAFANHQKSKKHKEMVELLVQEMEEEDDGDSDSDCSAENNGEERKEEILSSSPHIQGNINDIQNEENGKSDENIHEEIDILSSDEETQNIRLTKKQKKKRKQKAFTEDEDVESIVSEKVENLSISNDNTNKSSAKSKKAKRKAAAAKNSQPENQENPKDKETEENEAVCNNGQEVADSTDVNKADVVLNGEAEYKNDGGEENNDGQGEKTKSKEKQKKPKESFKCHMCKKSFSSRNQMFGHIKRTGHALKVDQDGKEAVEDNIDLEQEKGKKGKKKKK